ncbi:MAG TPA: hypothetical protein VLA19_27450 [Herpetosiphonaceae bacterium]|nr:hypothetical protein [Herpetosiphonaceae bacterium]
MPIIPIPTQQTKFRFSAFYHPYVCEFIRELRRDGLDGLMKRGLQVAPHLYQPWPSPTTPPQPFDFNLTYGPRPTVLTPYPKADVDFASGGPYSLYNWELFFHAPLLIADRLSKNQRFEEAQRWFHYIFDPTDTSAEPVPQKYWRTKPFFETTQAGYQKQQIQQLLQLLASGSTDPELVRQVREWRKSPFNPHVLARLRTTAYQKTTVMKYLDNLIAWGDQLFRRDTIESINEATQLYVLAADMLGRRPEDIGPRAQPRAQTYSTLEPKLDSFSNALVAAESLVPTAADGVVPTGETPPVTLPGLLYFCVPRNDKLLGYWDTVADRLFKVRHCMNIEGLVRQLPLFEPPIEPGLLVKAAAVGVDIASALADINAGLPPYRFTVVSQKAAELAAEVRALGAELLSVLEKRDAEALALLRSTHELTVLDAVRQIKEQQVEETQHTLDSLHEAKEMAEARLTYYSSRPFLNLFEIGHLALTSAGLLVQTGQLGTEIAAGVLHLIPDAKVGSPTTLGITYGGANIASSVQSFGAALGTTAQMLATTGSLSATLGGYQRRMDDWQHQADLAAKELEQTQKQITAAEVRKAITERELANHDLQVENAKQADEFLRTKFTNRELYDWMVAQVSGIYFQAYQLAYDVAKRAERCYRHELGLADSSFIRFGYWDSLKKGLLAGERLGHDIQRMEATHLDQNRREYELTKTVSLTLLDPLALVRLKQTGECFVDLPEWLFDLDYPGHYLRRIKAVSLTIPCVTGPYTGVHCTLSYIRGSVRRSTATAGGYARTGPDDPRFADSTGPVQSIATSSARDDAGLFALDFRDERYLPFEGQGLADSQWRVVLDRDANRFDFDTIPDVLIQVRYTAREGGEPLKAAAKAAPPRASVQLFSARHEFSDAWHRFLHPADDAVDQSLELRLTPDRFPFRADGGDIEITRVDLFMNVSGLPSGAVPDIPLELYDNLAATPPNLLAGIPLVSTPSLNRVHYAVADLAGSPKAAGRWLLRIQGNQIPAFLTRSVTVGGTTFQHLKPELVDDIYIICHYGPV